MVTSRWRIGMHPVEVYARARTRTIYKHRDYAHACMYGKQSLRMIALARPSADLTGPNRRTCVWAACRTISAGYPSHGTDAIAAALALLHDFVYTTDGVPQNVSLFFVRKPSRPVRPALELA